MLCRLFILFNVFSLYSQVIITEIYYDTPYYERFEGYYTASPHHLGEFIELYNYTTEDLPLKGWSITDKASKYWFPDSVVIPSESFLIIAYKDLYYFPGTDDYFGVFFPSTQGKESQIVYQQGNLMLRNHNETVKLNMGYVRGKDYNGYTIQSKEWSFPGILSNFNPNFNDPSNVNFYVNSLQLGSDGNFYQNIATPLTSEYVPETQNLEDVKTYHDAAMQEYTLITWEEYSDKILSNRCNLVIDNIEQSAFIDDINSKKCFEYDQSGNYIDVSQCEENRMGENNSYNNLNDDILDNENVTMYSSSEMEDIDSKILLYPNPTNSVINITWDESIEGVISEIQVFSTNGVNVYSATINSQEFSIISDLTGQPSGIYIVKIILNSGQIISKNVIKI